MLTPDRAQSLYRRHREAVQNESGKEVEQDHLRNDNINHEEGVRELRPAAPDATSLDVRVILALRDTLDAIVAALEA